MRLSKRCIIKEYQKDLRRLRSLLFLAVITFFFPPPLFVQLTAEHLITKPQEAARARWLGGSKCVFALVKGCGWDNWEGLSDFERQPLCKIRKGKLAFWGFAEPSRRNKTRPPWRSRGWQGRMGLIRGANRDRPPLCRRWGGVAVDNLGGVVNSIIPAREVLVRSGRQGAGGGGWMKGERRFWGAIILAW